jgi:hypothetical protein
MVLDRERADSENEVYVSHIKFDLKGVFHFRDERAPMKIFPPETFGTAEEKRMQK